MTEQLKEVPEVQVDEQVVLQKFDGEPLPENEVERLVVVNGEVTEHYKVENGENAGPVDEPLTGANIGRLIPTE